MAGKKLLALTAALMMGSTLTKADDVPTYSLVIHGGAGAITPDKLTPELEAEIRGDLMKALEAGESVLKAGGTALDAIAASIQVLENSPNFNAGRGAVFTAEGKNELDSSIMDGATLNAGAISGVTHVKNPILLARAVMEKSPHVMLQGPGAEQFADENGIERADDAYFYTDYRWNQLQAAKAKGSTAVMDHSYEYKFGTVGAVARDTHGNLAAGTSTGGMTNKAHGRVGDAPIIGAGTYADNKSCAVSATGHGEFFIRATVARSICALMQYGGLDLQTAANRVIMEQLVEMGGEGGIIAVDAKGNMSQTFNTPGMYRGKVGTGTPASVAIYKD